MGEPKSVFGDRNYVFLKFSFSFSKTHTHTAPTKVFINNSLFIALNDKFTLSALDIQTDPFN